MAFCPNCGSANNVGARFCSGCGGPLPAAQPQALVQPQPVQAPVQPAVQQQAQPVYQQSVQPPVQQPVQAPVQPVQPQPAYQQPIQQPIQPQPVYQQPIQPQPIYQQPAVQPVQSIPAAKSNGLCTAGFVLSLLGLFLFGITSILGLIFSVIGLIVAGKKKQKGKGKAIAGIIMSVIMIAGAGLFYAFLREPITNLVNEISSDSTGTRKTRVVDNNGTFVTDPLFGIEPTFPVDTDFTFDSSENESTETSDTSGDTEPDDFLKMGDSINGTVTLAYGTWEPWIGGDADEVDSLIANHQMQNVDTKTIIRLMTFDYVVDDDSFMEFVENNRQSMENEGAVITEYGETTIGGYDAYVMTGDYQDDEYMTVWLFADNDNYLHGVAVDYNLSDIDAYAMVRDTYTLE